jgi:DNA-binding NarL/FixJ family response regulator
MFRILIVEDMVEDSRMLNDYVAEQLPEAQVEVANNVQEGRELLEGACKEGRLYDAVILDFKLPESAGEHEEINESLCVDIGLLMPDAVVVHLTAFMKDDQVQEHMKLVHAQRVDKSAGFSKLDVTYPQQLAGCLRNYLYGARVEGKLKKLAPHADEAAPLSRVRRDRASLIEGSLTHEVASLQREISAHWNDYDARLKAKIERVFRVAEHDGRWIVTIL